MVFIFIIIQFHLLISFVILILHALNYFYLFLIHLFVSLNAFCTMHYFFSLLCIPSFISVHLPSFYIHFQSSFHLFHLFLLPIIVLKRVYTCFVHPSMLLHSLPVPVPVNGEGNKTHPICLMNSINSINQSLYCLFLFLLPPSLLIRLLHI